MAVVLDSSAVIGFLDPGDAHHAEADAKVRELLRAGDPLIASVVTFAEVLTGAKRRRDPEAPVRGFFHDLIRELVDVDLETAERASELRGHHASLRMPDALILAMADLRQDVERLVGGDRDWARITGLSFELSVL